MDGRVWKAVDKISSSDNVADARPVSSASRRSRGIDVRSSNSFGERLNEHRLIEMTRPKQASKSESLCHSFSNLLLSGTSVSSGATRDILRRVETESLFQIVQGLLVRAKFRVRSETSIHQV
jgi:hypothetical protein